MHILSLVSKKPAEKPWSVFQLVLSTMPEEKHEDARTFMSEMATLYAEGTSKEDIEARKAAFLAKNGKVSGKKKRPAAAEASKDAKKYRRSVSSCGEDASSVEPEEDEDEEAAGEQGGGSCGGEEEGEEELREEDEAEDPEESEQEVEPEGPNQQDERNRQDPQKQQKQQVLPAVAPVLKREPPQWESELPPPFPPDERV